MFCFICILNDTFSPPEDSSSRAQLHSCALLTPTKKYYHCQWPDFIIIIFFSTQAHRRFFCRSTYFPARLEKNRRLSNQNSEAFGIVISRVHWIDGLGWWEGTTTRDPSLLRFHKNESTSIKWTSLRYGRLVYYCFTALIYNTIWIGQPITVWLFRDKSRIVIYREEKQTVNKHTSCVYLFNYIKYL